MIRLYFQNLSDMIDPETGMGCGGCGGGYGDPETMSIYIDERLSHSMKLETIIHEAVELYCKGRIKHTKINDLTRDIVRLLLDAGYISIKS
ncbi:MAG: hypothetical protein PHE15_00290 [Dehalococcoidales bacterium]|nr:hypothetical protein [Dehalococcoidales bacterium]